jgi:uncharacterized protein (TIGR04222 family)
VSPLELRGPEFLALYVPLLAVATALSFALRHALRTPAGPAGPGELQLGPVEVALLAGGAPQAFDAAVVRLEAAGLLTVDAFERSLCSRGARPRDGTSLERAILDAAGPAPGRPIDQVRAAVRPAVAVAEARLASLGLRPGSPGAALVAILPLLAVGLLGVAKVLVGLRRDRPVGFLVVLVVGAGLLSLAVARAGRRRSRRGDDALRQLRRRGDGLRHPTHSSAPADLAMAVALFGVTALAGTPLQALALALRPPAPTGGSGCSTSSCGASSCGGGGCGGGGCGGCGS